MSLPQPVAPEEGTSFYPNQAITLRWGYAELPETWHFQVLLTDDQRQSLSLPDDGVTRQPNLTLPANSLPVGTYTWTVRLVELVEQQERDRGRSTPWAFTVQPYPTPVPATATPEPTFTPLPMATPVPTEEPSPQTPTPTTPPPSSRP